MGSQLTIGQLARTANVPVSTVRFYERTGLLRPEARTAGNYRLYGAGSLERLRFIRAAQAVGFTIRDVSRLLAWRDRPTAPCLAVQDLMEARLAEVGARMKDLLHVKGVLSRWLRSCRRTEKSGRCVVLDQLGKASKQTRQISSGP